MCRVYGYGDINERSSKGQVGQIFNNIRFAWMIYQIIPLSLYIPKIYTFNLFELSFFEISPFVWIQTMIVVEEVLKCRMAIIDYKKSMIHITL